MIISEDPKFILFSVNKTGTISMDNALKNFFDEEKCRNNLSKDPKVRFARFALSGEYKYIRKSIKDTSWNRISRLKHASPKWLREHLKHITPNCNWHDFYKFCFVRNPFDRLLSIYSFHRQKIPHKFPKAVEVGSFKAWLLMGGTSSASVSMKQYVLDKNGEQLLDFIGRYETIQQDWEKITTRLCLNKVELKVNQHTRTKHENWEEVFTQELRDIVLSNPIWYDDLEYFGYL